MWKLALVLMALMISAAHAADPVVFEGDTISILHDGSQTAYNPHTEAGKRLLLLEREACCVEATKDWHGQSAPFALNADEQRHLFHESVRFVVNPRTGAFVSTTTLQDKSRQKTDAARYVDSDITPMVALSDQQVAACGGCQPGDRVLIEEGKFRRTVWAVFGETVGSQDDGLKHIQISPAAAAALLIPLDPLTKDLKQTDAHLTLTIYPGSGYGPHFPHGAIPPVPKSP
jgi:hypothetical protein